VVTVPTGVVLADARQLLFDAAARVLRREGASGLTSRAVTAEAGVAKGVMHRHFTDFDAFLAALILDRLADVKGQADGLHQVAGTGDVADNLADALADLFDPVAVAIVALVVSREALRDRLRQAGTARVPLLGEGAAMVAAYLVAEQEVGRLRADVDVETLALTLVGAAHLLFADRESARPGLGAVRKIVSTSLAGAEPER
jgi:AcrR family transcriptional regulator